MSNIFIFTLQVSIFSIFILSYHLFLLYFYYDYAVHVIFQDILFYQHLEPFFLDFVPCIILEFLKKTRCTRILTIYTINLCNYFIGHCFLNSLIFITSLNLLRLPETNSILPTSILSTLDFKLCNVKGPVFSLLISDLSTSDFKLSKSILLQIMIYKQLLFFYTRFFCIIKEIEFNFYIFI